METPGPKSEEPIDPERVVRDLAPGGVTFFDVNWRAPLTASTTRVRRELKRRTGPTFEAFKDLGWAYGQRAPQMSELEFFPTDFGVRVRVQEHNEITFEKQDGSYFVRELRQLMMWDL